MSVAVIGSAANEGTVRLVESWATLGLDVELVAGPQAAHLSDGDIALARLDVLPTVDGVEPGLLNVLLLERRGLDVRNPASALLGAHDKLRTARLLVAAGVPHPRTRHFAGAGPIAVATPVVFKPRFGSWGIDVCRCSTRSEVDEYLACARAKSWYRRQGVLAQEEVPSHGRDLRVAVAGGRVVGAVERRAAAGEWRTNISCGGSSRPALVSPAAAELAATAAAAIDADFVGVDLIPLGGDCYVVVELNAAVDLDGSYSFRDGDVFASIADALRLRQPVPALHAG